MVRDIPFATSLAAAALVVVAASLAGCEEPDEVLEGDCVYLARALCKNACACTPEGSDCTYHTEHAYMKFENRRDCVWREANLFCRVLAQRIDVRACWDAIQSQSGECIEDMYAPGFARPPECTEYLESSQKMQSTMSSNSSSQSSAQSSAPL